MKDSDDMNFDALMGDVKPLKKSDKAFIQKPKADDLNVAKRREQAEEFAGAVEASTERLTSPDSLTDVEQVGPLDILAFKRDGIQEGVYKKLRLGKYPSEAMLDLHRKTIREARAEVSSFIQQAMLYAMRVVIISHGKGQRDPDPKQQAVMKSHVAHWLKEAPEVMAYHSAQPQHGGVGAVYVLLKKSEKAKAANRERHGHRG